VVKKAVELFLTPHDPPLDFEGGEWGMENNSHSDNLVHREPGVGDILQSAGVDILRFHLEGFFEAIALAVYRQEHLEPPRVPPIYCGRALPGLCNQ